MDVEWEDPPDLALARARTPGRYVDFAFALKESPGRWARLPDDSPRTEKGAQNAAQNIRRGVTAGFKPAGTFEAVSEQGKVWVRYAPPIQVDQEDEEDSPPSPRKAPRPDPAVVRAWARSNGHDVPDRGRLPEGVLEAYGRAHADGASVHPLERREAE